MPRRAVLAATFALLAALPARAQMVDGFQVADTLSTDHWTFGASVGGGVGSFQLHCPTIAGIQTNCYDQRERGASAYARAGLFPRRHVFVGLEAVGWRSDIRGVDNRALFVSLIAQLYSPWTHGLFLRGGAGAALLWADDGVDEASTDGAAWSVGFGYDVPVTGALALTPSVTYLRSLEAEIEVNGLSTQRAMSHHLLQVGLGLTWR